MIVKSLPSEWEFYELSIFFCPKSLQNSTKGVIIMLTLHILSPFGKARFYL